MNRISNPKFEQFSSPEVAVGGHPPAPAALRDDSVLHVVQFIRRRCWIVLSLGVLGLLFGLAANIFMPRRYTAKASLEVCRDKSEEFRLETALRPGATEVDSAKLDTEIEILRSRSLAMEVIRALRLDQNPDFTGSAHRRSWDLAGAEARGMLVDRFLRDLAVQRLGRTHLIQISVTSRRPELASLIANTLIDSYVEHTFRDNYAATAKISSWLDAQLGGLKEKLEKSQNRMLELQRDVPVFGGDQSQSIGVANLEELNRHFAAAQVERLVKEARYRAIRSAPAPVAEALAGTDGATQNSKAALAQLRSEYTSLIQTYGTAYPRVKELKAQIDQLESSVADQEQAQVDRTQKEFEAARSNEEMLRDTLRKQEQDANNNGTKAAQYELARKEYETNRLLYDGVQERLQEAGIMAGLHATAVHIVDNADLPVSPSQPRVGLNLAAGFGIGLFVGMALAFAQESLDTKLKTMSDIEEGLQLPLLAAIPSVSAALLQPAGFCKQTNAQGTAHWSTVAEALRGMRTSILLSSPGPPKVIMITSSRPGEGKTSVSCLMAITLALNGSRTLLIDADLRRPSVHMRFNLSKERGLSSVLSAQSNCQESIVSWSELPDLHILPSGPVPPLPSELLGSKRMEALLTDLRASYDFIVIDTSPVLTVTDASLLGRLADAAILIVRYGEVQRHVVLRCLDLLDRAGAKLLGVSVNAVKLEAPGYAEYYGRKYYEYYGAYDSDAKL